MSTIILDSGPLALLVHQRPFQPAQECRAWLARQISADHRIAVPAIMVYELRRELLRLDRARSVKLLDDFIRAEADRYLNLTDDDLTLAARLWADIRKGGKPTAHPHALDVDVILAAQSISLGLSDFVVATSNLSHLERLLPAKEWRTI